MDSEESKERDGVNARSNDSHGITIYESYELERWLVDLIWL